MTGILAENGKPDALDGPTNDATRLVEVEAPYAVEATLRGTAALLFHRWSDDAIAAKAAARKGSTQKKTDDVESYVYRCPDGTIGLPGEYVRMSLVNAAKYRQDPRSPRKSAMDLYKAGVVTLTDLASLGRADWDYLDRRRAMVQRSGITRVRPAFLAGWEATVQLQVTLPEYITSVDLLDTLVQAGRIVGVGDFRPTHGRFQVVGWQLLA